MASLVPAPQLPVYAIGQRGPPRPSHTHTPGEAGVVAENGLAARVECSLGPGVLGGEMALSNDDRGLRVLVDKASTKARASGVAVGDVLLSLDQGGATA